MNYLIIILILLSACGKAVPQLTICDVPYEINQDGIIINPQGVNPLPFAYYKELSDTQVLLEEGAYRTIKSNCLFQVKNGLPVLN